MKDRSRLLSSVIVSLLAGFIYYQVGDDIQNKISNSFKAVISYSDSEIYGPEYCQSFNSIVKKSNVKINKKAKFYIRKKNTIEFKKNDVIIPGDEMLSDIMSQTQANIRKATPDKNIDFSAELNNLIISSSNSTDDKKFKVDWKLSKNNGEVAENRSSKKNVIMIIKGLGNFDKSLEFDENTGYGFEYNYTVENENGGTNGENNGIKIKTEKSYIKSNSECKSNNECRCNKGKGETKTEKKVKVILPKINFKVNEEDVEIDLPEIDIQDETSEEDQM